MDLHDDTFGGKRRAPRIGFELMVRCSHGASRSTVMLKDMTRYGARIDGLTAPEPGEAVMLMLPGMAARMAFVMWTDGHASGLEFADPIDEGAFAEIICDFAIGLPPALPPAPAPIRAAA